MRYAPFLYDRCTLWAPICAVWPEMLASAHGLTLADFAIGGASAIDLTRYGKPYANPAQELSIFDKAVAAGEVTVTQPAVAIIELGCTGER